MKPPASTIYHCDALRLLERLDDGLFTLIYLEPPWGTDISSDKQLPEYHQHISMLVQQCWRVLNDKGTLYFHISSMSQTDYRLILNQAFGQLPSSIITWRHRRSPPKLANGPPAHDEILRYTKTNKATYNAVSKKTWDKRFSREDKRGPYTLVDITINAMRPTQRYGINGIMPPAGRSWRFTEQQMQQYIADGRIVPSKAGHPRMKRYFDETLGDDIGSVWADIPFDPQARPEAPTRPSEFCRRIIAQGSNEGDWLLDPICRDGRILVEAEKLGRKWVGCESSDEGILLSCESIAGEEPHNCVPTIVECAGLEADPAISDTYNDVFLTVDELSAARTRLSRVAENLAAIKNSLVGLDKSDDEILELLSASLPRLTWLLPTDCSTKSAAELKQRMPAFAELEEESQEFLVVARLLLEILPETSDQSTISISAWKSIENELNTKILLPFRNAFIRDHLEAKRHLQSDLNKEHGWEAEVLAKYLLNGKPPALGETNGVIAKCAYSKKTVRESTALGAFKAYYAQASATEPFVFSETGLLAILSQDMINKYRNGSAHTSITSRQRASESFEYVLEALSRILEGLREV